MVTFIAHFFWHDPKTSTLERIECTVEAQTADEARAIVSAQYSVPKNVIIVRAIT